jgi:hypothetical protein
MDKEHLSRQEVFNVADMLYKLQNPESKMSTPNIAYELIEKWYQEYHNSDSLHTFAMWCIQNKQPKNK